MKCHCEDVIHNLVGTRFEQYNYWGDYLTYLNLALLLISFPHTQTAVLQKGLLIFVCLYLLRWALLNTTTCNMDVSRSKPRPLLGPEHSWFILSGHLISNAMITYIIWRSKVHPFVKNLSLLFTTLVVIVQVLNREHYTIDMILTLVLLFLIFQLYG